MSAYTTDTKIKLQNKIAMLEVDLHGGAITDFHLLNNPVNPLSFRFSKDQMPENNKAGAVYQGHFICAGRWGEPSAGEMKAGLPNHGEPANIEWQLKECDKSRLIMETTALLEGLHIQREIKLDSESGTCHVSEMITNIDQLGRMYQVMQHPTIAAAFLNAATIINCNATVGFNYLYANDPVQHAVNWPFVVDEDGSTFDLRNPQQTYSSVFSFIVDQTASYGWVTAYSAAHDLVIGYVWPRKDYPWINLWQHYENNIIKYRGLEFGNTGLHQTFKNIIANNQLEVFGERTVSWLDAGETSIREYVAFLYQADKGFKGVENVMIEENELYLVENITGKQLKIGNAKFNDSNEK